MKSLHQFSPSLTPHMHTLLIQTVIASPERHIFIYHLDTYSARPQFRRRKETAGTIPGRDGLFPSVIPLCSQEIFTAFKRAEPHSVHVLTFCTLSHTRKARRLIKKTFDPKAFTDKTKKLYDVFENRYSLYAPLFGCYNGVLPSISPVARAQCLKK